MNIDASERIATLEAEIEHLSGELEKAKAAIQSWANANTDLARSAAHNRAKNQSAGRGFLGGLLGSKYRSAVRMTAAASNAAIARDVAAKRLQIVAGKRQAQDLAKQIQKRLSEAKQELRQLSSGSTRARNSVAKTSSDSLVLLGKLKEAYTAGLLTEAEYEEKRKKLLELIG